MQRRTYRRERWVYLALMAVTILAGLSTRRFHGTDSADLASNLGDGLWAVLVYLIYGFLFRTARPFVIVSAAVVTATAVEFSQLYHAPWIEAVRRTTFGGLVLGYDFAEGDLVCYYLGIATCLLCEMALLRPSGWAAAPRTSDPPDTTP